MRRNRAGPLETMNDFNFPGSQARAKFARQVGSRNRDQFRTEPDNLLEQPVEVVSGGQGNDPKAIGKAVHYLEGGHPNGAGRAEYRKGLHRSGDRLIWTPFPSFVRGSGPMPSTGSSASTASSADKNVRGTRCR